MPEIDRVKTAIAAFFRSTDIDCPADLTAVIERCAASAKRRLDEAGVHNEKVEGWLTHVESILWGLKHKPPSDKVELVRRYQEVTEMAMTALRATYPLGKGVKIPPEQHHLPSTVWKQSFTAHPYNALMDDSDAYAFAIFDTVAEDIGALLPSLYRLAVEGTWEDEEVDG